MRYMVVRRGGANSVEADWFARSRAAGVFYANNFSEKRALNGTFTVNPYADSAALRSASTSNVPHVDGVREVLLNTDPARALSGGKSLEIKTYAANTAANGGNWQDAYKDDESAVNGFYFQFAVWLQRDALAWVLPGTNGQMKVMNLEQSSGGQVVVSAARNLGFPVLLLNSTDLMDRRFGSVPYKGGGDSFYQSAIDSGSSLAEGTREAYLRRYGPGNEIINTPGIGHDYSYKSSATTGGDTSQNLLYNRGFAWPNADALLAGAEPYNTDGWTVVEVYINNDSEAGAVEPIDVLKMWVAPYGQPPVLVADLATSDDSLGSGVDGYRHFEALWYDTAFGANNVGEDVGYRPPQQRWYAELLGSVNKIAFPGGHVPL